MIALKMPRAKGAVASHGSLRLSFCLVPHISLHLSLSFSRTFPVA